MIAPKPRILFIDAYDSFSNNIISLLEIITSCAVLTVKIDNPILLASEEALREELSHYVAVVCGPGPGNPENEKDVGIMKNIWRLGEQDLLPVLGICLGFQSLCLEFGAKVKRLKGPQHGIIRRVSHIGEKKSVGSNTIFETVGELNATHYQSLCVDIGQDEVSRQMWEEMKWGRPTNCPELVPLAYVENDLSISNDSGIKDERVLVGVQHVSKPFWALQYHPESICTEEESHKVIKNWFSHATRWNRKHRNGGVNHKPPQNGLSTVPKSLLSQHEEIDQHWAGIGIVAWKKDLVCHTHTLSFPAHISISELAHAAKFWKGDFASILSCARECDDTIIFESTNANEPEPFPGSTDVRGRYSIIAMRLNVADRLVYTVGNDYVTSSLLGSEERVALQSGGIWPFISQYMNICHVTEGNSDSPFWGGLMGYTTYELGLETIGVESTKPKNSSRPDLYFAWVEQSLVIDHVKNKIYIQSLHSKKELPGEIWRHDIIGRVERFIDSKSPPSPSGSMSSAQEDTPLSTPSLSTASSHANLQQLQPSKPAVNTVIRLQPPKPIRNTLLSIEKPTNTSYESKVIQCQEHISNGDSYELCLTDQTSITRSKPQSPLSSLELYKTLSTRQPAPFASFIKLGDATLVSSSPERFLTWDETNHCSLRPMKGTVRKTATVNTLSKAKALLDVPKEVAENLMIVDLVRHDLHGVCGSGNVQVPRLCVVEEYKSVFQMISVVEGQVPSPKVGEEKERYTGLDVLAASLPPGSMTGAPKKRSCEILQGVEGCERGLYSGVVGYLDVRGRGDWSVTIRSMFKWDDEDENVVVEGKEIESEKWHIGAGGAVTTLSTAVGEREEMLTKLNGTLGIFA